MEYQNLKAGITPLEGVMSYMNLYIRMEKHNIYRFFFVCDKRQNKFTLLLTFI